MTDKLTIQDCRDAGFCISGVREACKRHNQDFRRLVKYGLPLEDLQHLDDLPVKRAISVAKARIEKNG